ncbi:S9 family peptidase [Eudoraea chungangensis]|uniref:S9 family peptidase n=1 Tax=Eudoraea chungangensis TaxID=1481905 RepID=UPI0023EC05F6|nr:S9 family peptidase [Eudoraea chungangensis]
MKNLKLTPLLTFCALIIFVVPNFNKVLAQSSNLTLEHFDVAVSLSSPRISPDGKKILLIVRKADFEKNEYINTLWMVNKSTKEATPLTYNRPSVNLPEWSQNGQHITFLAKGNNEKRQIFTLPVHGGEAQQITNSKMGVITYKLSPDGHLFAFVQKDSLEEKKGIEKHNKSFEVGNDWYLAKEAAVASHIWICSNEGKNEYQLTSGEVGYNNFTGSFNWSFDSKELVYIEQPKPHSGAFLNSSLQLINLESKKAITLDKGPGVPTNPSFSRDGSTILYSKSMGKEPFFNPHGLFSVSANGVKNDNIILDIDRDIFSHLSFSDQSFLVGAPDKTKVSLWKGQLDGNYKSLNTNGVIPSLNNMDIGQSDEIVFIGSTSSEASELYYMKDYSSIPEKITSFNDTISQLNLGKVSSVNWKGEDGFYEDGVITYPPDFSSNRKYPLVLYIHGGPMGSSIESFNFFAQALAAKGWIVFQPNYRGSNNLGKAYQSSVINDAGEGPGKDVMAGVKAVKELGFIDESKIAVSGWSYGGFMTVWLTSHFQGWKAAVAGAAVTDWFDWYNMADLNVWSGYGLGGSPWLNDNAENYRRQSPITYAHQIKTPTLILSNTLDQRVTVTQSFKLFHNLKDNGVETKFIAYPIPGHFPQDPVHRKDVYKQWISWIAHHF